MTRRGEKRPICPECLKKSLTQVCVVCNQTFDVGAGTRAFLKERGFRLPKRCPNCRKARAA
jgi:hypothetical protein